MSQHTEVEDPDSLAFEAREVTTNRLMQMTALLNSSSVIHPRAVTASTLVSDSFAHWAMRHTTSVISFMRITSALADTLDLAPAARSTVSEDRAPLGSRAGGRGAAASASTSTIGPMRVPGLGLLVVASALVAAGCSATRSASVPPSEAEIARLVIASWGGSSSVSGDRRVFFVEEFLSVWTVQRLTPFEEFADNLRSSAAAIDPSLFEAVEDFVTKAASRERVDALGLEPDEVILVTKAQYDAIFDVHGPVGWGHFYDAYPKSCGIGSLSRVGFSQDGEVAVIAQSSRRGGLLGQGSIQIYVLLDGTWTRSEWHIGRRWVA